MHLTESPFVQEAAFVGDHLTETEKSCHSSAYQSIAGNKYPDIQFRLLKPKSKNFEKVMSELEQCCKTLIKEFVFGKAAVFKVDNDVSVALPPPQKPVLLILINGSVTISYHADKKHHRKTLKPGDCVKYDGSFDMSASLTAGTFVIGIQSF